jgi:hypothetical protein
LRKEMAPVARSNKMRKISEEWGMGGEAKKIERATRLREKNALRCWTHDDGWLGEETVVDFVGALDKFSAIGSFDADSSSAPPPTCVQIEGFRESCDIPPRRCGKDRENVKNEEQTDRRGRRGGSKR